MEQRKPDSDLQSALEYNPQDFTVNDILHVYAAVYGENDEYDWYWVVRLKNKKYALIWGGCDYTGWD